jgi:hypothetical protein
VWKLSHLINKLKEKTGYPEKNLRKLFELSQNLEGYSFLINVGDVVMTSYNRLDRSRLALLQDCFDDSYENDLKGKAFEEACRKTLRKNKFNTLPERVAINEPTLPSEVSKKFGIKQKSRTDVDVIACRNNQVFVIECKEIKFKLSRPRDKNLFRRYTIEHVYKVKWISENFIKFTKKYLTKEQMASLSIDPQRPINFVPLVVTNRLIKMEELNYFPLITHKELNNLCSKFLELNTDIKKSRVEIEIRGTTFSLPCFVTIIDQKE